MSKNKKLAIILLGPPGAGKGTQAELLSDKLSLYYLETSKIIEKNIMGVQEDEYVMVDGKKYFLFQEKKLWETGKLCSPPLVAFWLKNKIKELAGEGEGLVFAGSPRTLREGREILPLLKKLYNASNIKIILIELSEEESIWRNSHRRLCSLMRHPILYNEETANLSTCPLDGSKLLKREGLDDPETIKTRLKEYKQRTLPLIDYFKEQGFEVKIIDGSPSPAIVFESILEALQDL